MRATTLVYAVLIVLIAAGCSNNSTDTAGVKNLSQADADKLNAPRSRFESADDPKMTADTYYAAGRFAESQNAPAAAIEQYSAALKVNPKHEASLFRLGVVRSQMRMYPEAIETWKKYAEVTKGSPTAYSNLGFCYELAGRLNDAEAAYQKGIAKDPSAKSCRVNYGLMLARKNRTDEAIVQLSAALSPAEVHYNLASIYEQQGRKDDARAEYNKALDLDPNLHDARVRLAEIK